MIVVGEETQRKGNDNEGPTKSYQWNSSGIQQSTPLGVCCFRLAHAL